jgi:hypothetical protein
MPPILALYARSRPARCTKRCSRPLFPRSEQDHAMISVFEASVPYANQSARASMPKPRQPRGQAWQGPGHGPVREHHRPSRPRPPRTRPQEATPRYGSTRQVSYRLYAGPRPHPRHILATDVVPPIPYHCAGQKAYHATASKGHSGAHAWACSDNTESTSTMPLQYKPRRHRIRSSQGLGLLLRQGSHRLQTFCNPVPP